MPKVTQAYRDARRQEIADAALSCFAAKGFQATSMSDIIAESGLSAGAIYGHFESKEEIMVAVAQNVMRTRSAELGELASRSPVPPPADVIGLMVGSLGRDLKGTKILLQIWGEAVVGANFRNLASGAVKTLMSSFEVYFTAWAKDARDMTDTEAQDWAASIGPVALGICQGYIIQSALFPDFEPEAYLESARSILPS